LSGLESQDDDFTGKISLSGNSDNGSHYAPVYNPSTGEFDGYS
jgi:hypothetical protein